MEESMSLFELEQEYAPGAPKEWKPPTFKDCVAADVNFTFFNGNEHADLHTVDGKEMLVVLEDHALKERSAHWEAGAKRDFDTGLYQACTVLYVKVEDYGPKPMIGKRLVMDKGTDRQRSYSISACEEECGVYRMTLERTRQG